VVGSGEAVELPYSAAIVCRALGPVDISIARLITGVTLVQLIEKQGVVYEVGGHA
jgi:hypothetical protein